MVCSSHQRRVDEAEHLEHGSGAVREQGELSLLGDHAATSRQLPRQPPLQRVSAHVGNHLAEDRDGLAVVATVVVVVVVVMMEKEEDEEEDEGGRGRDTHTRRWCMVHAAAEEAAGSSNRVCSTRPASTPLITIPKRPNDTRR